MATSIPVITLGKHVEIAERIAAVLAPEFKMVSVAVKPEDLVAGLERAADNKPKALLIGGAFTDEEAAAAVQIIHEWEAQQGIAAGSTFVVRVTPGTIEKVGPLGVAGWCKEQLTAANLS